MGANAGKGGEFLVGSRLEPLSAVAAVQEEGAPVGVFQCTTSYPCPPEKLGLNVISELRDRYDCPVGLSDHSGKIYAGLAAATQGTDMLEVPAEWAWRSLTYWKLQPMKRLAGEP